MNEIVIKMTRKGKQNSDPDKKTSFTFPSNNIKIVQDSPTNISSDFIGPPNPISNIPKVRYYCPPDETATEREFRLERQKVLEWNHKFWSIHNEKFFKDKDEFVRQHKMLQTGSQKKSIGPEEIAVFYRNFLNENRAAHLNYNKEWYKKNISLLWPAVKVAFIRLRRRMSSGVNEYQQGLGGKPCDRLASCPGDDLVSSVLLNATQKRR